MKPTAVDRYDATKTVRGRATQYHVEFGPAIATTRMPARKPRRVPACWRETIPAGDVLHVVSIGATPRTTQTAWSRFATHAVTTPIPVAAPTELPPCTEESPASSGP